MVLSIISRRSDHNYSGYPEWRNGPSGDLIAIMLSDATSLVHSLRSSVTVNRPERHFSRFNSSSSLIASYLFLFLYDICDSKQSWTMAV